MPDPPPIVVRTLRRALLAWYGRHQRKLPWRASGEEIPDPYRVLVSEAMLQQTQVATVVDYFTRFTSRFPTVQSLADADEQEVLRAWQGLGYYRRARNLLRAARQIVAQHSGRVPDNVDQLQGLPGVGRYTAGAVASIAYHQPAPILDGNVARVLSRLYAIEQPIDQPRTKDRLWSLAQALVPRTRPGDFNQALMELGALVCLPRSPRCDSCPLTRYCHAKKLAMTDRLPVRLPRRPPRPVAHHVLAIERRGRYLFLPRADTGLWAGTWQMPTVEQPLRPPLTNRLTQWASEHLGLEIEPPRRGDRFVHQTTHRTIRFEVWATSVKRGGVRRGSGAWRRLDQLDDLPMANPQRRIVDLLTATAAPAPSRAGLL